MYLGDSRFIWKPKEFLQVLKDKGFYQNPALSILSYPQDQRKGKWLPILRLIVIVVLLFSPHPPGQILCTLTDSSNMVTCHLKGGI